MASEQNTQQTAVLQFVNNKSVEQKKKCVWDFHRLSGDI